MKQIVILGGGTAGTIMANRLHKRYRRDLKADRMRLTVVDQSDRHVYQPGLLFVPFGLYRPDDIVRPRRAFLPDDVSYVAGAIDRVEPDENRVYLRGGSTLGYDALIVASGSQVVPEETEGMTGPGWREKVFEFYTPDGAQALARALEAFTGGRLIVNTVEMPIKCPVAPLEFVFLADWYFTRRGIRNQVDITYITPLDACFTRPVAAHALRHLLTDKGVRLVTEFATGRVEGAEGRLVSWDDRVEAFDLLVAIPVHKGAGFVGRSPGLGDEMDFVLTDAHTLQAARRPDIFAIGDATNLPTSKAGSVVHFEAEVLTENVAAFLEGRPLPARFDGHANCFIETGFDKALLIDFNYEVEPLPGRFPFATVGPLPLLKESYLNHAGKLLFRWVYWNLLLRGRDLPGIPTHMSLRGKRVEVVGAIAPAPTLEETEPWQP